MWSVASSYEPGTRRGVATVLCQVRPQRGRSDRRREKPTRHAYLWRDRPRAARSPVHEDHQPGGRGGLTRLKSAWGVVVRRDLPTSEQIMHIRKDDQVEVITGDDKGDATERKNRQGVARSSRAQQDRRRGGQPGLQAPSAQPEKPTGGPAVQGNADRRVERVALLLQVQPRSPYRPPVHRRRPKTTLLQVMRRQPRQRGPTQAGPRSQGPCRGEAN